MQIEIILWCFVYIYRITWFPMDDLEGHFCCSKPLRIHCRGNI